MAGKVIAITGANGGLGKALALRLAAEGEHVVLLGRSVEKVRQLASEIGGTALAVGCDVTSAVSVKEAFAQIAITHRRLDVLINNAAIFQPFLIAEATDEQIVGGVLTNLAGPMLCARSAIPMMERGAFIINVSSESVELPFAQLIVYQATKAGLERFSRSLQDELSDRGIRSCIVRAGQMMGERHAIEGDPAALAEIGARFFEANARRGLHLTERGMTHYHSATQVFRDILDLPSDMDIECVSFRARATR